jgi:hypothetical protein
MGALQEQRLRATGGAAVVSRLAYFYLKKCGDWVRAAAQPIAAQACACKVGCVQKLAKCAIIRSASGVIPLNSSNAFTA